MKEWIRSNEKSVYRVINAGVLAGMVLLGGEGFLGTEEPGRAHLLTVLTVLAVSACLNFMAVRGRLLCLAILFVFVLTGTAAAGMKGSLVFLSGFFPWLAGRGAPETWSLGYELIQTGLLTGICYLAQVLLEKVPVMKTAVSIGMILAMTFCLFTGREQNHYGVAFQLVFCVIAGMEWIQGRWKKVRSPGSSREVHTLWVMPFLALYLVLMAVMPAPKKPYDWQWVKNIYRQIQEGLLTYTQNIKWGRREGFGMAFSGFSGDGELKGGLQEESGRVMEIRVSRDDFGNSSSGSAGNIPESIYLTGSVYDTFDGRGWHQEWQGYFGAVFLDTAETLYAVRNYGEKDQTDVLSEVSLQIRYEDFNTGYVFAPLKTWSVGDRGQLDYECTGGGLRWAGQKGYGTEYDLRYFRINAGQQEFDRFLEEALNGAEGRINGMDNRENGEIWAEVAGDCEKQNGEIVTWDDMVRYRKEIYESYLNEIGLSPGVSRYLKEITGAAETDVEKLRAIERALRSFSYTLTPGELPGQVEEAGDFLDYFLLESRQGYCTYFATAFVLLARAEGIPARYVQGYYIPLPENGEAYVDSSMAHAWPEAYLEGVGWIPFEPTPGYEDKGGSPWGPAQPEPENANQGQENSLISEAGANEEAESDKNALMPEDDVEDNGEEAGAEKGTLFFFHKLLGMGIPMLLIVCTVVLAADYAISRHRYQRMEPCERFRMIVFRNLEILSRFGVKREEWETLKELRERAEQLVLTGKEGEEAIPEAEGDGMLCFIEDYEKVVYGKEEVREEMLKGAVQAGERLLLMLKQEKKWAYFQCRMKLLFGKI